MLVTEDVLERMKQQAGRLTANSNYSQRRALKHVAMQQGLLNWQSVLCEYETTKMSISSYETGYVAAYVEFEGRSIVENQYLVRDDKLRHLTAKCLHQIYSSLRDHSPDDFQLDLFSQIIYFRIEVENGNHSKVNEILEQQLFWPSHIWVRGALTSRTAKPCAKLICQSTKDPESIAKNKLSLLLEKGEKHPLTDQILAVHEKANKSHWRYKVRFKMKHGPGRERTFNRKQDARTLQKYVRSTGGYAEIDSVR